jgi:methylenetetrahydrofolate dehydrogenase (NADP+)/methenyltetrahydrofolate cyclohydrolase
MALEATPPKVSASAYPDASARRGGSEAAPQDADTAPGSKPKSSYKYLLQDPSWYYNPKNYAQPFKDDGVRGRLIDGKKTAGEIRAGIAAEIAEAGEKVRKPGLTVVLVGSDPASKVYVKQKYKACAEVGIVSKEISLPAETTPDELLKTIADLNADSTVDGILVQLPLPTEALKERQTEILETIDPTKDVDGFHPYNLGRLIVREPVLRPCTPYGVMHLIWSTGVNPYGLNCLVVGSSNIVGRPLVMELLLNGCTVNCMHRFSHGLEEAVGKADCLIVACGKPELVKGEWVKEGAIVIDVGINRVPETGKLVGDVDFAEASKRAGYITPVPGGVGPMTVAMLLRNSVFAWKGHVGLR